MKTLKHRNRNIILTFLPVLLIISIIFIASSQDYEDQDLRPKLATIDLSFLKPLAEEVSFFYAGKEISVERLGINGYIEFFIRKSAHVVVYLSLSFFFLLFLSCFKLSSRKKVVFTLLFIVLFASIDEYRHSLNPGRTGLVHDVFLDTFGGLIGTFAALVYLRKKEKTTTKATVE